METVQLPWENLIHCLTVLMVKMYLVWTFFCFSSCPLSLVIPLCLIVNSLASSFQWTLYSHWQAVVRCPRSHVFSRLNKPTFLSLSSQGKCSSSQASWCPLLNSFQFIKASLYWTPYSRYGIMIAEQRRTILPSTYCLCFPWWSLGCCQLSVLPGNTADLYSAHCPSLQPV